MLEKTFDKLYFYYIFKYSKKNLSFLCCKGGHKKACQIRPDIGAEGGITAAVGEDVVDRLGRSVSERSLEGLDVFVGDAVEPLRSQLR